MDGLREQRSDSSNDQRDNLLNSLHECDTYKELSKKRRDPEDITSIEQIEPKKSSLNDVRNFYSRLEEGFEYPESLINRFNREVTEKYDDLVEKAFLAYGIDREFIMKHRYDIRYRMIGNKIGYENIEVELMNLPVKLFSIHREYRLVDYPNKVNNEYTVELEGYLQLYMEHEGKELEEIKKYIQDYYQEKES